MKINKILVLLCALLLMASAVSATTYQVLYKDKLTNEVKLAGISYNDRYNDAEIINLKGNLDTFNGKAVVNTNGELTLWFKGASWQKIDNRYNYSTTSVFPAITTLWFLKDGGLFSLGQYPVTEERSEMSVVEAFEQIGYGDYRVDIPLHSGVIIKNPTSNSAADRVLIQDGENQYALEIDKRADLSQAYGSGASSVPTIYIHTAKSEGIEVITSSGKVLTREAWIYTYPVDTVPTQPVEQAPTTLLKRSQLRSRQ